ncbi:hypothetical protein A3A38_03590 [Candidatus Kaiserbacteria bacterium RIFCSPLOWO2_01_FULL_53_17]|uniref:Aspartate/glutamate/uridylate kinase domain-containing protein n=1 Tax=Candidatus Kaiserbacteria bacterium RIFCSPLOWO2_01_FULL_53_17 TaxID=1798511 RepID=A0A1F6EGM9_9BACT|nr:MAG: hypothetical protein A3A38_03590 [Candidatus Kaiserbacteria bacterium RIFCSPLOWO2_01_FULL_53_17]
MPRRSNVFIKVSGDEYLNPKFQEWIRELNQTSWVVICVGGGTQINEEFVRRGIPTQQHGPMGRETETFAERQIARDILEINQADLEDQLAEMGIHVVVTIPVVSIGEVLCHVNGDQMVRTAYLGFDSLYVVTTPERVEKKKSQFTNLPKVKVIAF